MSNASSSGLNQDVLTSTFNKCRSLIAYAGDYTAEYINGKYRIVNYDETIAWYSEASELVEHMLKLYPIQDWDIEYSDEGIVDDTNKNNLETGKDIIEGVKHEGLSKANLIWADLRDADLKDTGHAKRYSRKPYTPHYKK